MDQDDPEQRIAELERQVEEAKRAAGRPPWTNAPGPPPLPNAPGLRMIIALIGVVVIAASIGLVFHLTQPSQSGPGGGLSSNIPTSNILSTNIPTSNIPSVESVPPGGLLTINGTGGNETMTIACNDGDLAIMGKGHTLTVTGHCARLEINAMGTHVTVDSADEINVEGMDNVVIYHSGSPQVNKQGVNNSVQQG